MRPHWSAMIIGALLCACFVTANAETSPTKPVDAIRRYVAEFHNGSPCGFARGGMDEDAKTDWELPDGRLGRGAPGWLFTCGRGQIAVNRRGRGTGLGAADLGTGMGGGWPRPMIRGGLFVRHPRPGFGPYLLPVTLKATCDSPKRFLAAASPADGRPKFLGVVAEIRTATDRLVLAGGLKGTKTLTFGIYAMPGYKLLVEADEPPDLSGDFVLSARLTDQSFRVTIGTASVHVPLNSAQHVRAIAVRVAGVVGHGENKNVDRALVIRRMVFTYASRAKASAAPKPCPVPVVQRQGARLVVDGKAYRSVGMNHTKLLYHFARFDSNRAWGEYVLESLAAHGFTTVRVACAEHVPRFNKRAREYTAYRLFAEAPQEYFAAFDAMLAAAQRYGVRVIPVLIWNPANIADHLGTSRYGQTDFAAVRRTYFDPTSKEHRFLRRYLTALAGRYRDDGTILCWEIGNEWQNKVPQTDAYYLYNPEGETPNPYIPPNWKPAFVDHGGRTAWQQLADAQAVVATILKATDPNHLVLSGVETPSVHHAPDNAAFSQVLKTVIPPEVDVVGYHQYANGTGRPQKPWGYHPFLRAPGLPPYEADMHVRRKTAAALHNGRPLLIGECNVHYDPRANVRAYRLENLRKLLMSAAGVRERNGRIVRTAPVRAAVVLGWYWLKDADLVTGYSLYPVSMRHLYERPDLDDFATDRVRIFQSMQQWLRMK